MPLPPLVLAGLLLATDLPPPLESSGKWTVNTAERSCSIERRYGPDDRSVVLAIQPSATGRTLEVRILETEPGYVSRTDRGRVTLLPSGRTDVVKMTSFGPLTDNRRLTSFYLENADLRDLVMAKQIVIDRGHGTAPRLIAPSGSNEAVAAMTRCGDDLLGTWGVDAAAMHRLSRQPMPVGGAESAWFKAKDYPKPAQKNFRSGRTLALIAVDVDGSVTHCGIAESAGNPDLDARTCAVLSERGRYEPALDAAGKPVEAQKLVGVMWSMFPFFFRAR